ncbi:MAG: exonuclease SbcCD subunit D C-terminal domain-containing protein [Pseudomonadota bacterium]
MGDTPGEIRLLHTSDWHLGRSLYGRKRHEEFEAFLGWLVKEISSREIEVLLIAGDVFDSGTPGNRAQELYYQFLCRVCASPCRHVVVIAGNHDSPTFLNAPRELLKQLNVHVVGAMGNDPGDEVLVLRDKSGSPRLIVCAVPYLREKDIRTAEAGESMEDKNRKLILGIREHYARVCAIAEAKQKDLGEIPVVGMGHLFAANGKTIDSDGVRELYVGSLARVGLEVFPDCINYLALGHLHVPQRVGDVDWMRYSGSPIPMGFGEALHEKTVVQVTFKGRKPDVIPIVVPCFQELRVLKGTLDEIFAGVDELKILSSRAWLDIHYTGSHVVGGLRAMLEDRIDGSRLEIRRISDRRLMENLMHPILDDQTLDDLDIRDVFCRCLDASAIPDDQRAALIMAHDEILTAIRYQDSNHDSRTEL